MDNAPDLDAAYVTARLEEAGRAMLCIPSTGYSTGLSSGGLDFVRETIEAYGWSDVATRPAYPEPRLITRMDEALAWISTLESNVVTRRILSARALVHPTTDRHLFTWRQIGKTIGAEHKAVQRWHTAGIAKILKKLEAQKYFAT